MLPGLQRRSLPQESNSLSTQNKKIGPPGTHVLANPALLPELQYKVQDDSDDSQDEITIKYIIDHKPRTKVVREFFRENLAAIKSEEDLLFG